MNFPIRSVLLGVFTLLVFGCSGKTPDEDAAKSAQGTKPGAGAFPTSTPVAGAPSQAPGVVAKTDSVAAPAPAVTNAPVLESPSIQSGNFKVSAKGSEVSLPGVTITLPKEWTLDNTAESPRLANIITPEGMDVGIFWFGATAGGTVDDNIKRWDALFSPLNSREVTKDTLHNPRITFGRWQGGFTGDMGRAKVETPNATVLLTAILQTPKGSVYFKAVGSIAQASAIRGDLRSMIWGAKLSN